MKLESVRRAALRLPDTSEEPHFNYGSFRVGGRIFVTVPPEGTHIHVFVPEEIRQRALALHADCMEKLFWGKKAVGLRVALRLARAPAVTQLIREAWAYKATGGAARRR